MPLLLAYADDVHPALAQADGQGREVRVRGDEDVAVRLAGVEDVHGVYYHGRVRGVFAAGVGELLLGQTEFVCELKFDGTAAVRPKRLSVEISPNKPKQWSPCK